MTASIHERLKLLPVIISVLFFLDPPAARPMDPIYRFKGVGIPLALKIEGAILEKGAYDLEFLRTASPVLYYLRIMKKGKILHLVQGEEFPYYGDISQLGRNRDIPDKPTLKMTKNSAQKSFTMTFESGRRTIIFPLLRARFKFFYEEK